MDQPAIASPSGQTKPALLRYAGTFVGIVVIGFAIHLPGNSLLCAQEAANAAGAKAPPADDPEVIRKLRKTAPDKMTNGKGAFNAMDTFGKILMAVPAGPGEPIRMWRDGTPNPKSISMPAGCSARQLSFSPGGKRLAYLSRVTRKAQGADALKSFQLQIWPAEQIDTSIGIAFQDMDIKFMDWLPDEDYVALAQSGNIVTIWNTQTRKMVARATAEGAIGDTYSIAVSRDGRKLAATTLGQIFVWSVPDIADLPGQGDPVELTLAAKLAGAENVPNAPVTWARFSDDGTQLFTSHAANPVSVIKWDLEKKLALRHYAGLSTGSSEDGVRMAVHWSQPGSPLNENSCIVWDTKADLPIARCAIPGKSLPMHTKMSRDGKRVFAFLQDGSVHQWTIKIKP